VVPIRDLCESIIDCVNKTAPTIDEPSPYRMIRTTNVRGGRVDLTATKYVDQPTYERWVRRGTPRVGDIILTREAPLGEVGMLRDASGVFLGQRLVMYRVDDKRADRNFVLASMREHSVQALIVLGAWRLLALESKDGVHADRADSWEADDQAVFG
jgi:type I restriction enzyme S subunit